MRFLRTLTLLCATAVLAPLAHADVTPTVEHDGRYIYYRTSWTRLSKDEQVQIIDASVELLKNEIQTVGTKTTGLKTLSNTLLSTQVLDKLTAEAQQSLEILDNQSKRELLPAGLFIYGGGSIGAGFMLDVKGSSDIGLVVVPTQVVRVDTETGESISYFNLDWQVVLVPHLFVGAGVRAGASTSVGVGLIWGNLNRAQDFTGWVGSASVSASVLAGADVTASMVHDTKTGNTFMVGALEFDWGPEAGAAVDGSAGKVFGLNARGNQQIEIKIDVTAPLPNLPVPSQPVPDKPAARQ